MLAALDSTGNPSSVHRDGRQRQADSGRCARDDRCALRRALLPTSSSRRAGTEANALAIHGLGSGRRRHRQRRRADSVRAAAPDAISLPVQPDGRADLAALAALLAGGRPGPGMPDARQQRDRRDPARGRGRRALPRVMARCCMSMRCRRRAAFRSTSRALGAHALALSSHKLGGPTRRGRVAARARRAADRRPCRRAAGRNAGAGGARPRSPPLPDLRPPAARHWTARRSARCGTRASAPRLPPGASGLRRGRAEAAEHHLARPARRARGHAGDRPRSCRRLGQRGGRLQFGQGVGQPRPRRHGPRPARGPSDPRIPAVERDAGPMSRRSRPPMPPWRPGFAMQRPCGSGVRCGLSPHRRHDPACRRTGLSISTTRRPPGAIRACSPPCCPGSARSTATRTAPST